MQRPVTLYSLRQKFFSFVVLWELEFAGEKGGGVLLELERAELLVDDLPDNLIGRHGGSFLMSSKAGSSKRAISDLDRNAWNCCFCALSFWKF